MSGVGEEEEGEERFYESFDRILSSSCPSTCGSSSGEEEDVRDSDLGPVSHNYAPDFELQIPRFPMGVSNNYDVWISEPSSIEERRLRLLHRLGLSHDPLLSRRSSSLSLASGVSCLGDFGRSVSSDQLSNSRRNGVVSCSYSNSCILRSKSDGSSDHRSFHDQYVALDSPHIPLVENGSTEDLDGDGECIIKDLDNGKEFVVNDMWDNLREVGTGRHLTMEEFEISVGHSPIVQELMRRQKDDDGMMDHNCGNGSSEIGLRSRKKGGHWLNSIKHVASAMRRSSDERDTSSGGGGTRSSSATDDSQDCSFHGPERIRVRQYGKSCKELTGLYKNQEIQAHSGSIWTIKFSLDGKHLASAGEDCVIHVWEVVKSERKGGLLMENFEDGNLNLLLVGSSGSPEPNLDGNKEKMKKKRRSRLSISQNSINLDPILVPESIFGLSDKPTFSFKGHLNDVLDLSWSKSKQLLSSSMDKTVRLWDLYNKSCLKIFSHSDYVTCIQFNPVDERYFISGSLDAKVRIWNVPDCRVVDWSDLREMVTAACYTPDGKSALIGSYKGSCYLYNTSPENKLQRSCQIDLQNKKKKSHNKKITGFQFVPGSLSEVLVTSSDSRIRVVDGVDFVHKFKGFRNTNTQISASITASGKYVVSASEDSNVYVWKQEEDLRTTNRNKGITVARGYEHFHCQDVSIAVPWPGLSDSSTLEEPCSNHFHNPPTPVDGCNASLVNGIISSASKGYFFDRISATWPEEKLTNKRHSPRVSMDFSNQNNKSAWGMVIVTAGLRGEIRTYQNFGLPFGL